MTNTLLNLSPLDGRYTISTQELHKLASEYGLMYYRVKVEIEWFKILAQTPEIAEIPTLSDSAEHYLNQVIENFDIDEAQHIKEIEKETNHDVKAVEYYLKEKFNHHAELKSKTEFIHFACTSEDINNLAYALMLSDIKTQVLLPKIQKLLESLSAMSHEYASISMLSRTHGQSASPTTVGKEIANVVFRLTRQYEQFETQKLLGKLNGAVGNFNAHCIAYPEVRWEKLSQEFIRKLGLQYNPLTTQIEPHDTLAEYFHILIRLNTILIDFSRDIWGYISLGYFKQKLKEGEIGSSTMPHKVNPIDFENAEGNLGLANALLGFFAEKLPISRWQRDLTDSTVLRNVGVGIGYMLVALKSLEKGIGKLEVDTKTIQQDLENRWEVLAEAIQTVMRRYNVPHPYEKLKSLTRGKDINHQVLTQFIDTLEIPNEAKERLKALKPETYTGLAKNLINV